MCDGLALTAAAPRGILTRFPFNTGLERAYALSRHGNLRYRSYSVTEY